jgi:hypothetical protein
MAIPRDSSDRQLPLVLPLPSTNQRADPRLEFDGGTVLLTVFLRDGESDTDWIVEFRRVRAFLHRAEPLCEAHHYESSYDQVVAVQSASWSDLPKPETSAAQIHSFALTLDGWGCLEVLAAEVAVISP